MSTNIRWFTDTIGATLQYTGDDDCDFSDEDVNPADADTVTRDGPWTDFFDTSEFLTFEATVAQPVVQPYIYNDELHRFRKTEDELTRAQAQIENLPWTMGHPPKDRVTDANQIRGVWTDPYWDDGQHATLHIPANDPEAVRYAVSNGEVSVGFGGRLDWADTESATYDATQRDMAYDHIASVENARCPPEKGCQLHADELSPKAVHGHVTDNVQTQATQGDNEHMSFTVGDWVQWESSGGPAYGNIDEIIRDGCTSRGKGDMEVCAEDGDPATVVEVYDNEAGESQDEFVRHKMSTLNVWSPSFADMTQTGTTEHNSVGCPLGTCSGGPCSCGLHVPLTKRSVADAETLEELDLVPPQAAQNAAQTALDHREETDAMNETGWNRAEQLAAGEELSPSDIADGTDGMANWWARHRPHTVSSDGDSLQRDEDASRPEDHSWIAGKGWGGIAGMNWALRMKDTIEDIRSSESTTTDGSHPDGIYVEDGDWYGVAPSENPDDKPKYDLNTCNDVKDAYNLRNNGDYDIRTATLVARIKRAAQAHDCPGENRPWTDGSAQHDNQSFQTTMTDTLQEFIDEQNLDVEDVIDALDVEVPTEPTAFYDGEPDIETLADDFDAVDILVDEKERLAAECDDLRTELREAQRPVFADKAEKLSNLTQRWGDEDDLMAKFDAEDEEERWTVDDIEAKIDLVEDIVDEETTTVTDNADNGANSGTEPNDEPDIPITDSGRFDLRTRTKIEQR